MSGQIELIIRTAEKYIGEKGSLQNSNNVIFNTRYYGRPVSGAAYPWCCTFIWCLFQDIGAPELFYGGAKTASCTMLMKYAKANNLFRTTGFCCGDLALFNWQGAKTPAQHIGIITGLTASNVQTIEGNTSVGSDSNGGEVMRRTRGYGTIVGVYRPDYKEEDKMKQAQFNEMMEVWLAEQIKKAESEWSVNEGFWAKAKAVGVLDGMAPQGFVTREQLAAVLGRAGVIR